MIDELETVEIDGITFVKKPTWTLEEAVQVCKNVEEIAPIFGCHVALTGGTLYKEGSRKDLDLLFYRIRQIKEIDKEGLLKALEEIGFVIGNRWGWVIKAKVFNAEVDLFFPDYVDQPGDEERKY